MTLAHSGPWRGVALVSTSHSPVLSNVLAAQHARFYKGALPHGIDASYPVEVRS